MGKYATYRKRGSHTDTPSALPAPGMPVISEQEGDLLQESASFQNTNGTVTLEYAEDSAGPWTYDSTEEWAVGVSWGETSQLGENYYRAYETGGGVQLAGQSPYSNIFDNTDE